MVNHGGLFSNDGVTLDDIRAIDRFKEPPDSGLMTGRIEHWIFMRGFKLSLYRFTMEWSSKNKWKMPI